MKKVLLLSLLALLVAVLPSMNAYAQGSDQIHYQGQLTMDGDKPVNGQVPITFSIYDQEFGGSALWVELQDVPVVNGFFNVYLGSVNPINLKFDGQYWLEMQIGNAKYPRQQLTASPYAMSSLHAIDADTANVALVAVAVADGAVGIAGLADELKNFTGDLEGEIPNATIKRGVVTQDKLAPNVTVPPSGPASGDLTGTYPDPLIAVGAVKTDRIFNKAVTTAKIDDMAVTTDKIDYQAVTPEKLAPGELDQVLMTNASGEVYWGIPELPEYPDGGVDIYGDYWTNVMVGGIHGRQIVEDPVNYPVNDGMVYMYDEATRMWIPVATAGDVTGPIDEIIVTGIQEIPVSDVDPLNGQVFMYDGTQWAPTTAQGDVIGPFDMLDIAENTIGVPELVATNDDDSGNKPRDLSDNGRFMYFADAQMYWSKAAAGNDRMTAVWDDTNAEFIWDAPASNVTFPLMGTGTYNPNDPITLQGANNGNEILTWTGSAWEYDLVDEMNLKTDIYPGQTEDGWVLTWDATLGLMTWDEPYAKVWTATPITGDGSAADPVALVDGLDGEIYLWDPTVNGGEWVHQLMAVGGGSDISLLDARAQMLDLQINPSAVGNTEIANDAVDADKIADDAVGEEHIQTGAVTSDEIENETIQTIDIANDAVTTAKIDPSVNPDEFMVTTGGGTTAWATFNMNGQFTGNGVSVPLAVAADAITTVEIANDAVTDTELANNSVDTPAIQDDAVTTAKIDPSANTNEFLVTTDGGITAWSNFNINGQFTGNGIGTPLAIAAGAVTSVEIAANAVTDVELADGSVDNAAIQADAVTVNNILESPNPNQIMVTTAGGVTAWESLNLNAQFTGNGVGTPVAIAADAITATEIAANAVTDVELNNDAVDTPAIQNNAVTTGKIAPGNNNEFMITTDGGTTAWAAFVANPLQFNGDGITNALTIGADAITATEIAANAVTDSELNDGAVDEGAIQANAVTTGKIAPGNNNEFMVTTDAGVTAWAGFVTDATQFTGDAVTNPLTIATNAITATELADNSVDNGAIQANAIDATKIQVGAVTTDEILNGTIAAIDIANDAIESQHIAAGAINDATFIANDVINPDHMDPTGGVIGNALIIDAGNAPAWGTPDIEWTSLPDGTTTGQFAYWNGAAWVLSTGAAPTGTQVIKWMDGPGEAQWADDALTIPFAYSGVTNAANDPLFSLEKTDNMGDGLVVTVPTDAAGSDANAIIATGGGPAQPTVDVIKNTNIGLSTGALRVDADVATLDENSYGIYVDYDIADDGNNAYNTAGIMVDNDVTGATATALYTGGNFDVIADGGLVAGALATTDIAAARNVGMASFVGIADPAAAIAGLAADAGVYTQVGATTTGVEVDADQGIGVNVQNDGANTTGIFVNNGTGDGIYTEAQDAAALVAVSTTTGAGTVDVFNAGTGEAILAASTGNDPTVGIINLSDGEAIEGINTSATDHTAIFGNLGAGGALFVEAPTANGVADDNYVAVVRNNSGADGRGMLIEGIAEDFGGIPPFDGVYGAYTDDNDAVLVVRNNNAAAASSLDFLAIKTYGSIQANSGMYSQTVVAGTSVIVGDPNGANVTIVPPAVPGGPMVVGGPMDVEGDVIVATAPYSFDNPSADEDVYVKGNLEVDGVIFGGMTGTLSGGDGLDSFAYNGSVNVTANVEVSEIAGAGLEDDGANNLRISAAAAGDGLAGGAGSPLEVTPGNLIDITGDAVTVEPSVTNGDLMQTVGGIATWQSVATVMADLEDGQGIADFTYDGSGAATVAIDLSANAGLQFNGAAPNGTLEINTGDGVTLNANALDVVVADFAGMNLEDDGANNLRIAATAAGDGLGGGGAAVLNVNTGDGVTVNADNVEVVVADFAGDGLIDDGSNNLEVNDGDGLAIAADVLNVVVADFAGTGLEDDGVNNLRISAAAAGDGLAGGGGSPLEVTPGNLIDITGDAVTVEPSVTNGDLMQTVGGIATWQSVADIMADLTDGNGIADFTYDGSAIATVEIDLTANAGLEFTGAAPNGTLGIDEGMGLYFNGNELEVNQGDGLAFNGDVLEVDEGNGLTFTAGVLEVDQGDGLGFNGTTLEVDEGDGLNFNAGVLQVNQGDGLAFNAGVLEVDEADGLQMIANQLAVNVADFAGAGLVANANDLDVNVGDGLGITADVVAVELSATPGLEFNAGDLQVATGNLIGIDGAGDVELTAGANGQIIWTTGGAAAWANVATVMADLEDGDGIADFTYDGGAAATVAVEVADFAGTGLEDDGSNDLRIAAAAAGDGLAGGAGAALSVNVGNGLEINADVVEVELEADGAIVFDGVNDGLEINTGNGITITANALVANTDGTTIDFTAGQLRVTPDGITGTHIANSAVASTELATDGATGNTMVTAINNGTGTIADGRIDAALVRDTENTAVVDISGNHAAGYQINTASAATGDRIITAINQGSAQIDGARLNETDPTWSGTANQTTAITRSGQVTIGPAAIPVIIADATAGSEVGLSTAINWAGTYATTNTHALLSIANTPGAADGTNYGIYAKALGAGNYAGFFDGDVQVDDADFTVTNAGSNVLFADDDGVQVDNNVVAGGRAALEVTNATSGEAIHAENTGGVGQYTASFINNGALGETVYIESQSNAALNVVNNTSANDAITVQGGIQYTGGTLSSNPVAGAHPLMLMNHGGTGSAMVASADGAGAAVLDLTHSGLGGDGNTILAVNDAATAATIDVTNLDATNGSLALAINNGATKLSYLGGLGGSLANSGQYSVYQVTVGGGNITALPSTGADGQIFYVINTSGGVITVTGAASGVFALNNGEASAFVCAGNVWYRIF